MTMTNRRRVLKTLAAGSLGLAGLRSVHASQKATAGDETIGIGIIGAGGRGNELAGPFSKVRNCRIVAVADPDSGRAGKLAEKYQADAVDDLRRLLDRPDVHAVAIATCNHWHCLAAIWAMQAGKDVYVEKPLSHTQWEGRQVVQWARQLNRIVQLGTQQRSDPMQSQLKQFLHTEKQLGEIEYVQANRMGVRSAIGKRSNPLQIPQNVHYNLWLGPAEDRPLVRNQLHYDWHWDWNTGNGEMGNWGVHVLDDVRNVAYMDRVSTPTRLWALGNRLVWDDAGNTPNVHYAIFETELFPTVIALSNLPTEPGGNKHWQSRAGRPLNSPGSGYVVACEGGFLQGQRGSAKAVDLDGKTIREFRGGDMVRLHIENFVDAVRAQDRSGLNAEVEIGHASTGWCNLANVGLQVGMTDSLAGPEGQSKAAKEIAQPAVWQGLMSELVNSLKPFGLSDRDIVTGPVLTHNPKTERFEGELAEVSNQFLVRDYRDGFAVPTAG